MTFSGPFSPNHPKQLGIVNYIGEHFLQSITVDGTQAVYGLTTRADRFRIDFLNPVTSWGATFYDLTDETRETDLRFYDGSDTLLGNILVSGQDQDALSFHGIDLDVHAASYVEFVLLNAPNVEEFFIIDNVRSSIARDVDPSLAPVLLPASSRLLLSGGIAMVALRRRCARQNPRS